MIQYKNGNCEFQISPDGGELFVDNSIRKGSGHLGHAMVEYEPGKILCFYPHCDGKLLDGHNGFGWMEYKRTEDCGKTWSAGEPFPYSKTLFDLNLYTTAMCEKAVLTPGGDILVFTLICELNDSKGACWEPHGVPTYLRSKDGGRTWGKAERFGTERGRIWDLNVHDGKIYVLMLYGANPPIGLTEYHLFVSEDDGATFQDLSVVPMYPTYEYRRYYGNMAWLDDGSLIVYSYRDREDEFHVTYMRSFDEGKTWPERKETLFAKRIRNMQIIHFENSYFLFGRSGSKGTEEERGNFVVYFSTDGMNWDEGTYLQMSVAGNGAYSNTLLVHKPDGGTRVLVQASHAYSMNRTNVYHWWIDCIKK